MRHRVTLWLKRKEARPMSHEPNAAAAAPLIADPTHAAMLSALMGAPYRRGELADASGLTAQTASSHLAKLLAAGVPDRGKGRPAPVLPARRFSCRPGDRAARSDWPAGAHQTEGSPGPCKRAEICRLPLRPLGRSSRRGRHCAETRRRWSQAEKPRDRERGVGALHQRLSICAATSGRATLRRTPAAERGVIHVG